MSIHEQMSQTSNGLSGLKISYDIQTKDQLLLLLLSLSLSLSSLLLLLLLPLLLLMLLFFVVFLLFSFIHFQCSFFCAQDRIAQRPAVQRGIRVCAWNLMGYVGDFFGCGFKPCCLVQIAHTLRPCFFHRFQVKHVEELGAKLKYITPARIFFSNLRALDMQCYCWWMKSWTSW